MIEVLILLNIEVLILLYIYLDSDSATYRDSDSAIRLVIGGKVLRCEWLSRFVSQSVFL